jgi:hypothetical protein
MPQYMPGFLDIRCAALGPRRRWLAGYYRTSTRVAGGSLTARVADRVARLVDDARVRAYETLGDRPRAVEILERRLLAD